MKRLLALTVMAFLAGCCGHNQVYNIADVTKPETIMLKKVKSQYVYSVA